MNAVYVLSLGLIVVFLGYRVYAKYIDEKWIRRSINSMLGSRSCGLGKCGA